MKADFTEKLVELTKQLKVGDPTLREADSGLSGQIIQATLEQSTVDIGTEFTKMIIVQRAFSASAKILSTADEMLEELLRTKR